MRKADEPEGAAMIIGIGICSFLALCGVIGLALCKASGSDEYERKIDDEAQMKYLKEWREKHGK